MPKELTLQLLKLQKLEQPLLIEFYLRDSKELAFEGHRLFDLNRNKRSVTIIQGDQSIQSEYPNDKFILPIPLSELNANTNMVPNPGY